VYRRPGDPSSLTQLFAEHGRQLMPVGSAQLGFLPNTRFDAHFPLVLVNARQIACWWVRGS